MLCVHEAQWAAGKLQYFFDKLMTNLKNGNLATASTEKWEPATWPTECRGVGFTEAPRRGVRPLGRHSRWQDRSLPVRGADHLERQPARSQRANTGAYEAALMNTKLAIPEQPLEILRTLHSFLPVPRLFNTRAGRRR